MLLVVQTASKLKHPLLLYLGGVFCKLMFGRKSTSVKLLIDIIILHDKKECVPIIDCPQFE